MANGTVARAYQELESAGLVVTRRAAGTRVAATLPVPSANFADQLAERVREFILAGRRLGATDAELLEALAAGLRSKLAEPSRGPNG